jgi:Glycosyl transferase family 90
MVQKDAGTGLKWALFSNSVVMMTPPKYTSWAMEELLEPWVHYIPLNEDLSDVAEKMKWVLDNDVSAQDISHRGALWIRDLVLHPDALKDDLEITEKIAKRYLAHFRSSLRKS